MLIRICIVDDQVLFSESLRYMLQQNKHFLVSQIFNNPLEAVEKISRLNPDIVITDFNMKQATGLELLERIHRLNKDIKFIVLTVREDKISEYAALKKGAKAFLNKNCSRKELFKTITDVYHGVADAENNDRRLNKSEESVSLNSLSYRELEIIRLLAKGNNNESIADMLFISASTVKTHRKNIFKKINVKSIAELVNYAHRYNLLID